MDYRFVAGAFLGQGPAAVWMRMRQPLVAGEPTSPLAAGARGGGLRQRRERALDYRRFLFINTELTVHLMREPAGEWVCLDAVTRPGTLGVGLAEACCATRPARLGRAAQTLLVRRAVRGARGAQRAPVTCTAATRRTGRDPTPRAPARSGCLCSPPLSRRPGGRCHSIRSG